MATLGKSVLLDTSVVVRHFRDGKALVSMFAAYDELYFAGGTIRRRISLRAP